MKHYVLVHGAWEGAWSWDLTQPVLQAKGHKVTAVDLPGSPGNPQQIAQVTLDAYVQSVIDVIKVLDEKVILVGHSMAGVVISQVAEFIPERIENLVYVTAFLLKNGGSVYEAMASDEEGEFLPLLSFSEDQSTASAASQVWRDKAFHDAGESEVAFALPQVADLPQSTAPLMSGISVTETNFGRVPKSFIRTSIDKMISPKKQDEMIGNWKVDQVYTLEAGHFPTLSVPQKLAELLLVQANVCEAFTRAS